jgi:hypothetical protein
MSVSCRNRAGQHGDFQIAQDLNSWRGFGVEPRQGDWSLMQAHIRDVLADGDQEAEGYILNWAAWAVQNPGKRAEAALVFRGDEGTGKGVFLHALGEIFGVNGQYVDSGKAIVGAYNDVLESALFLYANEISRKGPGVADRLKSLITDSVIPLHKKFFSRFSIDNHLKVAMASDHSWVIPAGPNARRFAVFDVNNR